MKKTEGYRYIREFRARDEDRRSWALYEVQNGRARRVGVARKPEEASTFLFRGVALEPLAPCVTWVELERPAAAGPNSRRARQRR